MITSRDQKRGNENSERVQEIRTEIEERLLEVVVRLGAHLIILQVLAPVESDHLRLDLSLLDIHLVPAEHNWDAVADSREISVPGWHIFVREPTRHIEHDYRAVAVNVVAISEPTELLLTRGVPAEEPDLAPICIKVKRAHLFTAKVQSHTQTHT